MRLSAHIVLTIPIVVVFYAITKSLNGTIGVFISGILIDVDHFLEFWHDCRFNLDIGKFFEFGNRGIHTRHFILLHSYELLLLFFIAAQRLPHPYFFWGMAVGVGYHIFLDYINIIRQFRYKWYSFVLFSFLFRLFFVFKRDKIDYIIRYR